ncbi:MAG: YdcF family protein [Sphingomonadales bacterium]|nr:YdcF family protein [Sphingomonadales bacterium]
MVRRILSLLVLAWLIGFVWFAIALPQPHEGGKSDGVVVLTGGGGRIGRGLEALEKGWARRMLVSGVDREVRASEFQAEYKIAPALMACCVALGFQSVDTRSNAREAAHWIAVNKMRSVRLVTTDWHMRRAAMELGALVPGEVALIRDAVPSQPTFRTLFLEYNKLLARAVQRMAGW